MRVGLGWGFRVRVRVGGLGLGLKKMRCLPRKYECGRTSHTPARTSENSAGGRDCISGGKTRE